jgi:hypothetical protein
MAGQAGTLNLYVNQHATFVCQLTWKAGNNGQPFNVSGYQALLQARLAEGGNPVFEASTTNGMIELGTTNGRVVIRIPADKTSDMKFNQANYDLLLQAPNGDIRRIVEGLITVRPGVSRFDRG